MRKRLMTLICGLLVVSCGAHHQEAPPEKEEALSCFSLCPEGGVDEMLHRLEDGGLVGFRCGEMLEQHTDYADFYTLTDDDTSGGAMQVVVAWNPSNKKVYDLSYYWHLSRVGEESMDVFGSMESEALAQFGLPTTQRVANDDGYGTHYLTTTWEPTATQGYRVCLELSYDSEGNPPLLMLEVTNPVNEF